MASLNDLLDLGMKIVSDFETGSYASLVTDFGTGFSLIGNLLGSFGLKGTAPEFTDGKFAEFCSKCQSCIRTCKGQAMTAKVGSFDPSQFIAALQMFLDTVKALWGIFHPSTPASGS